MAILKTNLEEPILTRSERALLQTLQHAAQLAEGIKILDTLDKETADKETADTKSADRNAISLECREMRKYLRTQIAALLKGYKLPRTPEL